MSATLIHTCDVCGESLLRNVTADAACGMRVFVGYPEDKGWKAGRDCDIDVCGRPQCHEVQRQREAYVPEEDGDTVDTL